MRLYLLPISRTRSPLIYCCRVNQQLTPQTTLLDKISARANDRWLKWEKSDVKWQKRTVVYGNKLFERIPYEEWGLKSIPPLSARRKKEDLDSRDGESVTVTYAPSSLEEGNREEKHVLGVLGRIATERQALHRRMMWFSIVGMPLTIPVGLIPIIPNLPFFYLVFRAWSHWRALRGSQHLEFLIRHDLVKREESPPLDLVYDALKTRQAKKISSDGSDAESEKSGEKENMVSANSDLLLDETSGALVAEAISIPEVEVEISRAVKQITLAQKEAEEKARKEKEAPK
ncbi:hypothetical protein MMC25_005757 [Agyrium rufum]|nr:hypothetical protein [Agyrium rufum]